MPLPFPATGVLFFTGKGGVGKTTVAAAVAVELVSRGHAVHLSTTDPVAHLATAVGSSVPGLTISRIDPAAETLAYSNEVLAAAAPSLDDRGRALLAEDLRSPCTEEIAVFRAFARVVAGGEHGFVVLDTAPVHEAAGLQDDLRRAGIEPFAWVVNQSFAGEEITDPILRERGQREHRYMREVADGLAERVAWVPWQPEAPEGATRLLALAHGTAVSRDR